MKILLMAALVMLAGAACGSPLPEQDALSNQTQQKVINALKMAPRGPVELILGYCDNQSELPARKQVVAFGDAAVFSPTEEAIYELEVKPLKAENGKIVLLMTAKWQDKLQRRDSIFMRHILANDGEVSQKSILKVDGADNCFTVTALSRYPN